MEKRALVISGGGSFGAFAGGLAKKMYDTGYRWNHFYGTSTGALLNTLISHNDFNQLKEIYTNVENRDIFSKAPFNQKGRLNVFRALWRTMWGRTSIGDAERLLNLIRNSYTEEVHNEVLYSGKVISSCVTNYTKGRIEYGYNTKESYDDFVLYTFASASVPVAMDLVKIGEYEYLDGGVMEHVPIQKAIDDGADSVDVIVLRPDYVNSDDDWKSSGLMSVTMRTIDLLMREVSETDLIIGKLKNTLNKDININIYYIPKNLQGNSLVFDKETMNEWWDYGYRVVVPDPNMTTKSTGLKVSQYRITVVNIKQ